MPGASGSPRGTALSLVPLPPQPDDVPWPTSAWPEGSLPPAAVGRLDDLTEELHSDSGRYGVTYASLVVHRGRIVHERYDGALAHWDRPAEPVGPATRLLSWSMAKSMLHAVVGMLVGDGRLDLASPAPVPEWSQSGDPRRSITLQHLLEMRDGLAWSEDYVDAAASDVIDMLFGAGRHDVAAYAAARPLAASPGTAFNYSSGTSNIVSGVVARAVGPGAPYRELLRERLFGPIGMGSAEPGFDDAGTWVGSSYVHATTRDFARFGLLYLRDGVWEGRRLLPAGWVDRGRRALSWDQQDQRWHGAHWWVVGDDLGTFWASGYEGQSTMVCPGLDLVVVRMGRSTDEQYCALQAWRAAVLGALRAA